MWYPFRQKEAHGNDNNNVHETERKDLHWEIVTKVQQISGLETLRVIAQQHQNEQGYNDIVSQMATLISQTDELIARHTDNSIQSIIDIYRETAFIPYKPKKQ